MSRFDAPKDASPCNEFDPMSRLEDLDDDGNTSLTSQALNADGTPRRPMNAFMIFARRRRPQVSAENQSMRTGEVSKILSKEWNSMPPADKQFYLDQAKILKDNFNAKYPDYVYRRRPNNSRRRRRADSADGHSVDTHTVPSDDGSQSPTEPPGSRGSTSPLEKTGPSASAHNPPFPSAPSTQYRRPLDNFLPPLSGSVSHRSDRAWQEPTWPSPRSPNYGYQPPPPPFYPSPSSPDFRGNPTSYPHTARGFDSLELSAPRISSSRMPFEYMGEYPPGYNAPDSFATSRVPADLSHPPSGQYNLPPLQKPSTIPYAHERIF